jgi:hypothetical protein
MWLDNVFVEVGLVKVSKVIQSGNLTRQYSLDSSDRYRNNLHKGSTQTTFSQ